MTPDYRYHGKLAGFARGQDGEHKRKQQTVLWRDIQFNFLCSFGCTANQYR